MSSYTPPHLRNRAPSAFAFAPSASAPSVSAPSASAVLRQGTMASLTRSDVRPASRAPPPIEAFPDLKRKEAPIHSSQDKKGAWGKDAGAWGKDAGAWGQTAGQRFSDLARSWGTQQKEEEEERKRLAKERITAEQKEREREEKERAYFRIVDPTKALYGGKILANKNRFKADDELGGDHDELAHEVYEEESESDQDAEDVSYRRSKHDL